MIFQSVSTSTTVVVANSAPSVRMPVIMPPNYAAWSWFTCLCCFFPIGIAAIIASNNVSIFCNRIELGDLEGATGIKGNGYLVVGSVLFDHFHAFLASGYWTLPFLSYDK